MIERVLELIRKKNNNDLNDLMLEKKILKENLKKLNDESDNLKELVSNVEKKIEDEEFYYKKMCKKGILIKF
jgi:hypothetical protein